MLGNILTNVSVGLHKEQVSWGNDWRSSMNSKDQFAALEVMCREREALAKKEMEYWLAEAEEWKQLRESPDPFAEDVSPRPRVIPDPTINRLHATAPPPKGTRLYADVTGCSRYCTLLRVDLFNRYTAKNWNAAMTRGPITFPGSCCNNPTPASSNCIKPANVPNTSNADCDCL